MTRPARSAATVVAVVGILLGAGTAGFLVHRLAAPQRPTLRPALAPTLPARTDAPEPTPEPRVTPDELPDFSLPDLEGTPHKLADWRGHPLAINFWATWCEPCRREIPLLNAIRLENRRNSFEVVGIAIDHRDSVLEYSRKLGISYPILVGEKGGLEAVTAFGVDVVLPFTVFADSTGRIVTLKIGELHRDEATFILARLTDLEAGRLSLTSAREQIGEGIRRLAQARASPDGQGSN